MDTDPSKIFGNFPLAEGPVLTESDTPKEKRRRSPRKHLIAETWAPKKTRKPRQARAAPAARVPLTNVPGQDPVMFVGDTKLVAFLIRAFRDRDLAYRKRIFAIVDELLA